MSFATFLVRHYVIPKSQVPQPTIGGPPDSINSFLNSETSLQTRTSLEARHQGSGNPMPAASTGAMVCHMPRIPRHHAKRQIPSHPQPVPTNLAVDDDPPQRFLGPEVMGNRTSNPSRGPLVIQNSRCRLQRESTTNQAPRTHRSTQSGGSPHLGVPNEGQRNLSAYNPFKDSIVSGQSSLSPQPKRRTIGPHAPKNLIHGSNCRCSSKSDKCAGRFNPESQMAATIARIMKSYRSITAQCTDASPSSSSLERFDATDEACNEEPKKRKQSPRNTKRHSANSNTCQSNSTITKQESKKRCTPPSDRKKKTSKRRKTT